MARHPVRLVVTDELGRLRLTVFFRLLLALPHAIWLLLWTVPAIVAGVANWVATLAAGRSPAALHRFLAAYVRYTAHVNAYASLAAEPFPGFTGRAGSYPIDVEIAGPERQNRWLTGFRIVLVLPAGLLALALLGGFPGNVGSSSTRAIAYGLGGGVLATVAFLAWFACLARGRMPRGFRDLVAYVVQYGAQVDAYLFVLTDRYPNSDTAELDVGGVAPRHPIRFAVGDDLRRSRFTVFFRFLLALPHLVWLVLWGVAAHLAAIANWAATLVRARPPAALHRFLAAYVRYQAHATSYLLLVANPFPGFTGKAGIYPVDVEVGGPERQNRWITGFRLFLAVPALLVGSAVGSIAFLVALLGWFAALATGRMPQGLRNLGAYYQRYNAQTYGYLFVLTDRYPYSGPTPAAGA